MQPWHSQDRHVVRVEWGPAGAEALTKYAARSGAAVCAVVVDVLSFTTSVSVGVDAGMRVHPYRWKDRTADDYAREHGAVLARPRSETRVEGGLSLSPSSIRAARGVSDLVLPSPNGSTISALLADAGAEVAAASLRNRTAVAQWLVDRFETAGRRQPAVVIVPAGERWPDGSLRPAAEDPWGAGAVVAALVAQLEHRAGPLLLSPEAELAGAAWLAAERRVADALATCASGRELIEQGWPDCRGRRCPRQLLRDAVSGHARLLGFLAGFPLPSWTLICRGAGVAALGRWPLVRRAPSQRRFPGLSAQAWARLRVTPRPEKPTHSQGIMTWPRTAT